MKRETKRKLDPARLGATVHDWDARLRLKLRRLGDATDDVWDDVRGGLEQARTDMKRAGAAVVAGFKRPRRRRVGGRR